ncbi:MAG: hypothetical protein WDM78_10270 [Puia sp.]
MWRDTGYLNIRVRADRAIVNFDATKLAPCESLNYMFTIRLHHRRQNLFNREILPGISGMVYAFPAANPPRVPSTHAYAGTGTYMATLILNDTSYCNYPGQPDGHIKGIAPGESTV